jgi:hypothetical protein
MNDPACYERFVYTDTIDNYKNVIEDLHSAYEQTPESDHNKRDRITSALRRAKIQLAKTQFEYAVFKRYQKRTDIQR